MGHCTNIRWYIRNRCVRKEQFLLFDLFKAFDLIESTIRTISTMVHMVHPIQKLGILDRHYVKEVLSICIK